MTKRIGRRTEAEIKSASMKLTWLQTTSAAPSSGTCSTPRTRRRYSRLISSQTRKRIRNSGTSRKMCQATSAFSTAVTSRICGMFSSSAVRPIASPAASTMNRALRMLLAAITRETSSRGVRDWIRANRGTMKKPPNRPISARSISTRQRPGWPKTSPTDWPSAPTSVGWAK